MTAPALELDLDGDLAQSGERPCSDIWVRARRCPSSFPARWLDTADLTLLHDASDRLCGCSDCHSKRLEAVRARSERLLETVNDRILAELYELPSNDNGDDEQSSRETSRPPMWKAV